MTSTPPTLVFVHGGLCDAADWRAVAAALERSFPIIAENLPGHGGAPLPPEPTIAALSDALHRAIGAASRAILVGHSMGCAVALEASRRAQNLAGLILIEGGMGAHAEPARTREALEAQIDAIGLEVFQSRFADTWFDDPQLRIRAGERLTRFDCDFARELLLDAVRWDSEDAPRALGAIQVPLLAVQTTLAGPNGRRSLTVGETTPWLDLILRRAPNARTLVLAGMGHFPHVEQSAAISEIITRFARELEP